MADDTFAHLCIFHILDGLRDGLSHFSSASRVALAYQVEPDDPLRMYDPHNLLSGHEPKIKDFYLKSDVWTAGDPDSGDVRFFEEAHKPLQLAGIISYGGRSRSVWYQRWFTDHHLDLCSSGPIVHWLEIAVRHLSQSFAARNVLSLDTAGHALQQCAVHAIRDYIVDRRNALMGWDTHLRVYPILDATLGISKTPEEGNWPRGKLVFVEPSEVAALEFMAKFPPMERPRLENFKHVRKLLQSVEHSERRLLSDGSEIVGIVKGELPPSRITAEFHGNSGFLRLGGELVASISDGNFQASNRRANLVQLEEALLESGLDPTITTGLYQVVTSLVNRAGARKHGCTLAIDLGHMHTALSGQTLTDPLDLTDQEMINLACSLSKVDGALHIGADLKLHAFACLLDGRAVPGENRARGARYNSALRFTNENEKFVVVVVSADRPVSIIQRGVELTARCEWQKHFACVQKPPTMEEWVKG